MKKHIERFLYYLTTERYLSQNTIDAYSVDLYQWLNFIHTAYPHIAQLEQLSTEHIKAYISFLRNDLHIAPRSASRKLSALKAFSKYMNTYHQIPLFTQGIHFPKLPKRLPKHITIEQVQRILDEARKDTSLTGYRNKVIICLLYTCGIRVSELLSLHVEHINVAEASIRVIGKGNKERMVPLTEEIVHILQWYLEHIHPQFMAKHILFPSSKSKSYLPRNKIFSLVKKLAHQAGLHQSISPHVLRHSLATHLLKKGAHIRMLQTLLGHEKINTVQMYTHLDSSHLRLLYDRYHIRA